ncbi:MAG TPA: 50S ribosomal protein L24 [Acidimicrobiales bacterium]|jgi:large subunit ribosomal protein L24|nr:50S ribosomal protein L24 [Acidimicrobiales bacterium]MDP6213875.1 50S ribosomal protein L24 [Acidimicrobiales bacterium]MDP7209958.1 50S ribosomal protein L24 [Acidimicrobiales bacterium]HJL89594.1 50S ribosomal protein L24 [Acidimicrobiales bacterium]HJO99045.1 50S ribosomal protein L24 [Acidimicrobiales bacterium]|tara:strand:- start:3415 stop:3729 length:315 start_codon:yes stop_codon:yes gene_type:complete
MKIKKGDTVRILAGKDRGREGEVTRALPSEEKVIVEGVNIAKRHQKPTSATMQGGIIDKAMPLHVSNVAIISPSDGEPTRVGYRFDADGVKIRICRRTGVDLDG